MSKSAAAPSQPSANLHKYTSGNKLYQMHLDAFMAEVYELVASTQPASVLEAGCGEGFLLQYIARQDPSLKLTGIDAAPEAIRYANEHFADAATFRKGDIYKLPFSDRSFDTVLCSEVLEHLDEPDRAVAELKRVARKAVVLTVPLEPWFGLFNGAGRLLRLSPDPGHVNFWTKRSFQAFVRNHFSAPRFGTKHVYQLAAAEV